MNNRAVVVLVWGMNPACLATSFAPFAGEWSVLDRIATFTTSRPETKAIALEVLERVALGRTAEIAARAEAQIGLAAGQLQRKEFQASTSRACAFRAIGKTAPPEAVDFLSKLKRAVIGPDGSLEMWRAAQIARNDVQLRRIADPQLKTEFLESLITRTETRDSLLAWAVDKLCDSGAIRSLPEIRQAIRRRLNGKRDEEDIRFCEGKIQVISSNPDRIKALSSVLRTESTPEYDRLQRWSIYQLADEGNATADAELRRFAAEIGRVPASSPQRLRLAFLKQLIETMLATRPR